MNVATLTISILFAAAISLVAHLTALHRGPFGAVLRRLRGSDSSYQSVASMLWVVAGGVVVIAVVAYFYPEHAKSFAQWGIFFFAVGPSLVAAILPILRRRAP
jgi:hypothetical protein